jgi:hypothetical protein
MEKAFLSKEELAFIEIHKAVIDEHLERIALSSQNPAQLAIKLADLSLIFFRMGREFEGRGL